MSAARLLPCLLCIISKETASPGEGAHAMLSLCRSIPPEMIRARLCPLHRRAHDRAHDKTASIGEGLINEAIRAEREAQS